MNQMIQWSVFRGQGDVAVVPQSPLLIRLRQMTPDTFFSQDMLKPLKSLLDTNFIIGPTCILAALYLPRISLILVIIGLLSLTCLLYTSPSPRDKRGSRMPSSA